MKFPPPWANGLLNPSESITIPFAKFKDEVRGSAKPKESNHKVVNGPIPPIIESTVITPSFSQGEEGGVIV